MVITRYNETDADARAVALTNGIDSISTMVGVNFSHPSGRIVLNDFAQFTHFTATFEGITYVYKVTGFSAINNNVCEITYTLDYMKSWFLTRNITSLYMTGARVSRCTNSNLWNKFITDPQIIIDGTTRCATSALNGNIDSNGCYIAVVNYPYNSVWGGGSTGLGNPHAICVFSPQQFETFCDNMYGIKGAAMQKQISKVYFCPFTPSGTNVGAGGNMKYFELNVTEEEPTDIADAIWKGLTSFKAGRVGTYTTADFGGTTTAFIYPNGKTANGRIEHSINLLTIDCKDFRDIDYANYQLYIPYYGTVDVPVRDLANYDEEDGSFNPSITYVLDALDGTISFYWSNGSGDSGSKLLYPFVALPSVSLPSGDAALSIDTASRNYQAQQTSALIGGLTGAITGGMTPTTPQNNGTIGALSNAIGTATGMLGNELNMNNTALSIARNGNNFVGTSSNWSGYADSAFRLFTRKINTYYYENACSNYIGYPVNKFVHQASPTTGDKVWLDMNMARLNGLDWFVQGVKNDLGSDYIYYNK